METAIHEGLRRGQPFEALERSQGGKSKPLIWTNWEKDGSVAVIQFNDDNTKETFNRIERSERAGEKETIEERLDERMQSTPADELKDRNKTDQDRESSQAPVTMGDDGKSAPDYEAANPSTDDDAERKANAEKAQRFLAQQDPRAKRDPELAKAQTYVDVAKKVGAERWPGNDRLQRAYVRGATDAVAASLRNGDELGGIAYRDGQIVSLRQAQQATPEKTPEASPAAKVEQKLIEQRTLRQEAPRRRM